MDPFLEKLKKASHEVEFSSEKKAEIKSYLHRIVEADLTVREGDLARHNMGIRSNLYKPNYKTMSVYAVIAIVALLGGGTSFGAEAALPGDALYPVKVSVNENVRAAFTFGAEAKANWEIRRAERRLEETATLSAEGRLDAESRARIEENFQAHADRVEARIAEMEAKGNVKSAAEVASRFETSLRVHQAILAKLEAQAESQSDVQSVGTVVNSALNAAVDARTSAENKVGSSGSQADVKVAAEARIEVATKAIASVRDYLEKKKAELDSAVYAKADAQIKVAESLVVDAKAKVVAEAYAEAFNLASQAVRTAETVRLQTQTNFDLNLDLEVGNGGVDVGGGASGNSGTNVTVPGNSGIETNLESATGVNLNLNP